MPSIQGLAGSWFASHENVLALAGWLNDRGEFEQVKDCLYFFENPWKWENQWGHLQHHVQAFGDYEAWHDKDGCLLCFRQQEGFLTLVKGEGEEECRCDYGGHPPAQGRMPTVENSCEVCRANYAEKHPGVSIKEVVA